MIRWMLSLRYLWICIFDETIGSHAAGGANADGDVIDEVRIALDAFRAVASIGHNQDAAWRIVVTHLGNEGVPGGGSAPVPVTKDCEVPPGARLLVDPLFKGIGLAKEDVAVAVCRVAAGVAAALQMHCQQPYRSIEFERDIDTPAKVGIPEAERC